MLRRLLLTASLVASTFFVTGAMTTQAVNAATRCAPSAAVADNSACEWRQHMGKYCYYCEKDGRWTLRYCR